MKFNIQNPSFLQMGCVKAKNFVCLISSEQNVEIPGVTANGDVIVESTYQGRKITQNIISPVVETTINVQSDADTPVFLYGDVTYLDCSSLKLTSLDLSKDRSLTTLNCSSCKQITSLDLTQNKSLTKLECSYTNLTSLDLSQNIALQEFTCGYSKMTALDFSGNPKLTKLSCNYNTDLESIDLSKNVALTTIYFHGATKIRTIRGVAVNETVATVIASAITSSDVNDGSVILRNGDEYNNLIESAATEKGWEIIY